MKEQTKEYVMRKKELYRRRGKEGVPRDSKCVSLSLSQVALASLKAVFERLELIFDAQIHRALSQAAILSCCPSPAVSPLCISLSFLHVPCPLFCCICLLRNAVGFFLPTPRHTKARVVSLSRTAPQREPWKPTGGNERNVYMQWGREAAAHGCAAAVQIVEGAQGGQTRTVCKRGRTDR